MDCYRTKIPGTETFSQGRANDVFDRGNSAS